jgi:hypothetical protein
LTRGSQRGREQVGNKHARRRSRGNEEAQMTISKCCEVAIVALLAATLTGCLDAPADEAGVDGIVEQAVVTSRELRLLEIRANNLNEGGDEIYLTASRSENEDNINVIRPVPEPDEPNDYWRFDQINLAHFMNLHVGTILQQGLLIVNLMEQDFGDDQKIGTIDFQLDHNGAVKLFNTPTGVSQGVDSQGRRQVQFAGASAIYTVWFKTVP